MSDKYVIMDNNREEPIKHSNNKPIEEVLNNIKIINNDVASIKSDMAVIKNRLYELIKQKEREQQEREELTKGWFWG